MKHSVILLTIGLFFSCTSPKSENQEYNETKIKYLKSILTNTKINNTYKLDESIFSFNEIIDSLQKTKVNRELIYVLNSDCSYCIGSFFEFISLLRKTEETISLSVIISTGSKETIKYYMQKFENSKNLQFQFFENINNKYINGSLDNENGKVFYIYNGKLIDSFSILEYL